MKLLLILIADNFISHTAAENIEESANLIVAVCMMLITGMIFYNPVLDSKLAFF